jgi:hypothetical protein
MKVMMIILKENKTKRIRKMAFRDYRIKSVEMKQSDIADIKKNVESLNINMKNDVDKLNRNFMKLIIGLNRKFGLIFNHFWIIKLVLYYNLRVISNFCIGN